MISFTQEEIIEIRKRSKKNPTALETLEKNCEQWFEPFEVQKTGIANWTHYYYCPKHSVPLEYNSHDPFHHKCPIDGEIFSGGNYDTAWWGHTTSRQGSATFSLAFAYLLSGDRKFLVPLKKLFTEFAKYYKGYEVHGDIPYNHPGKAFAQVLDDSAFLNYLGRAYDIISDEFTEEEQTAIKENIFRPGAEHLMKYRTDQIHNHEVCNDAATAILGLILEDESIINHAVNEKYGLKYQLKYATLPDGMWFEGSMGYHFYASEWFSYYNQFSRYTKYSLTADPESRKDWERMLLFPRTFLTPSGTFPKVNDGHGGSFANKAMIYEQAYAEYRTPDMLDLLHRAIDGTNRDSLYSLLYGVEDLPEAPFYPSETHCALDGSKCTMIYGEDKRFMLMKNMPYGGEHDHYDRLAIDLQAFDKPFVSDIGTCGYGAFYHYAYFKNTASHNTVCMGGKNMPPANPEVLDFTVNKKDDIRVEAQVEFSKDFPMLDSFTIEAWSHENYDGVKMRRVVRWFEKYVVDFFFVDGNEGVGKDYTLHILGKPLVSEELTTSLREEGPQSHIKGIFQEKKDGLYKRTYHEEDFEVNIWGDDTNVQVFDGFGISNPSTRNLAYLVERSTAKKLAYVHVIELCKQSESVIQNVSISQEGDSIQVTVQTKDGENKVLENK